MAPAPPRRPARPAPPAAPRRLLKLGRVRRLAPRRLAVRLVCRPARDRRCPGALEARAGGRRVARASRASPPAAGAPSCCGCAARRAAPRRAPRDVRDAAGRASSPRVVPAPRTSCGPAALRRRPRRRVGNGVGWGRGCPAHASGVEASVSRIPLLENRPLPGARRYASRPATPSAPAGARRPDRLDHAGRAPCAPRTAARARCRPARRARRCRLPVRLAITATRPRPTSVTVPSQRSVVMNVEVPLAGVAVAAPPTVRKTPLAVVDERADGDALRRAARPARPLGAGRADELRARRDRLRGASPCASCAPGGSRRCPRGTAPRGAAAGGCAARWPLTAAVTRDLAGAGVERRAHRHGGDALQRHEPAALERHAQAGRERARRSRRPAA